MSDDLFGCTLNPHCYLVNKTRTPCGKIVCPLEDEVAEENQLTPELTCGDCKVLRDRVIVHCDHRMGDVEKHDVACVKIVLSDETTGGNETYTPPDAKVVDEGDAVIVAPADILDELPEGDDGRYEIGCS